MTMPRPTTPNTSAATTFAMDSMSVTASTPNPIIVNGLLMLRIPPRIGRIQSPYVVFDAIRTPYRAPAWLCRSSRPAARHLHPARPWRGRRMAGADSTLHAVVRQSMA